METMFSMSMSPEIEVSLIILKGLKYLVSLKAETDSFRVYFSLK